MIKSFFNGIGHSAGKFIFWFLLALVFLFFRSVSASTIPLDWGPLTWNSHSLPYTTGVAGSATTQVTLDFGVMTITDGWDISYNSLALDICSTASLTLSRTNSSGSYCSTSCFEQTFYSYNTGISCSVSGYTGTIYRHYLPIKKWNVGSGSNYFLLADTISVKNNASWYNQVYVAGAYLSNDDYLNLIGTQIRDSALQTSINNLNSSINNSTNSIINNQNQNSQNTQNAINGMKDQMHQDNQNTQNAINGMKDQMHQDNQNTQNAINGVQEETKKSNGFLSGLLNLFSDNGSNTNANSLGNVAGWLPPGPIDSILNLPLSFLNAINNVFNSSTCVPISLTLPFVNSVIELPCWSTIVDTLGIRVFWESMGTLVGGIMAYYYLLNLYTRLHMALTLKEMGKPWGAV